MLIVSFCAVYLGVWARNKILSLGIAKKENLHFAIITAVLMAIYYVYTQFKSPY